jgi:hypothetical protein
MKLPLYFVATYSDEPMWAACVRAKDGVRFSQLNQCASIDSLRKIEFTLNDLTPSGDIRASIGSEWRVAKPAEIPNILMNLGHRLVFAKTDLGWAK